MLRLPRTVAVAVPVALTLGAFAGATGAGPRAVRAQPGPGGTAIVALDQDLPSLNPFVRGSNQFSVITVVRRVLAGAYSLHPARLQYVPDLVARAEVTTRPSFAVTYTIRGNARWNDGRPITARDFEFTWRKLADPRLNASSPLQPLHAKIERVTRLGPKRVRFVFKEPVPAWKSLFSPVLPLHALAGEDLDAVWRDRIDNPKSGQPIASGPFRFARWIRGAELVLRRNEGYWRGAPRVRDLVFRFVRQEDQVRAVRSGAVHVTQPITVVLPRGDLAVSRSVRVRTGQTLSWAQIDFNFGGTGNSALRRRFVRQAVARAIDREAVRAALHRRLLPGLRTLQSAVFLPRELGYRTPFRRWRRNTRAAARLLSANGCRRGGDGIFSCRGRRLSFRFLTDTRDQLRELAAELIQTQVRRAGIELRRESVPNIDPALARGDWDVALVAWNKSPGPLWAEVLSNLNGCNSERNQSRYCNRTVSRLLRRAAREPRTNRRVALLHRADALMSGDLPTLPLVVRAGYIAHSARIRNVVWNPADFLWNVDRWWIAPR